MLSRGWVVWLWSWGGEVAGSIPAGAQLSDILCSCAFSLPSSDHALPRRTPPPQPKHGRVEAYQSLPKLPPGGQGLASEYQYAADRLSLARVSLGGRGGGRGGTAWQLYEWQQRQRYRHGSPTAPGFAPVDPPRSVSVPPSPSDVPPSQATPPRRPHTPAERVTVRPLDPPPPAVPPSTSPRRLRSQTSKVSTAGPRAPEGAVGRTLWWMMGDVVHKCPLEKYKDG